MKKMMKCLMPLLMMLTMPGMLFLSPLHATLSVDPSSRQASLDFYNQNYLMANSPTTGWTGSFDSCDPGTTDENFKTAIVNRINYFRAMAGVPAGITLNATYNSKAQAAAFMMSVNSSLSHTPPSTWTCYSEEGREGAGNSNLYLGQFGWEAISGYIKDPGDGNHLVGHRRWILNAATQQMGTGDIPFTSRPAANALWVFDDHIFDPRPPTRHPFVAWPPPGFVPYTVVYPRWSFAYPDADFTRATITMTSGGTTLPTQKEPVENGYGDNTLVWLPNNLHNGADWPRPNADTTYRVFIDNVIVNGEVRSFSYDVTVFNPVAQDPITVSIDDARVTEGNEGNAHEIFTVTLSKAGTQTITVRYATSNGSAVQPEDYTPVSGTLSFASGETSKTVIVPVKGDTLFEADETLFLNLSNPINAALGRARGTAIIVNDDPAPPDWQAVDLATGSDNLTRLLWARSDNAFSAWLINADHKTYSSTPRYGPITDWKASNISVGGDGKRRILLNRSDKAAAVWTVDANGGFVSSPLFSPVGFGCRDIATAQNNTSRLLWVRGDEAFALWLLGTTNKFVSTPLYGPIAGWKAQAIGVGGDSKTRVLMVNGGQAAVWTVTVDATGNFSSTPAYAPTGFACRHMAVGSDNKPRLLWVRGDEAFAVWTLDSAGNIKSTPLYGPIPGWKTRAISVGADGKTRVLLNRTDGQAAVWILDDAGNLNSTPGYGPFPVGTRSMQLLAKTGPAPSVIIKGPAPSPLVLSTAVATPGPNGAITLRFSGDLEAKSSSDVLRYTVTINGAVQTLTRATHQAESVTLHLDHPLQAGDEVRVWWQDLRDNANCTLSGSSDTFVVR